MRKIVGGKRYDTETAREVGRHGNAGDWTNAGHYEEVLFRKKNGEYFIHGAGGADSKYSVQIEQNRWAGGELVIPMAYECAKKWAAEHLRPEDYTAAFGDVMDGETLVALNANLSAAASDKLRKMASAEATTIKAILERLIMGA